MSPHRKKLKPSPNHSKEPSSAKVTARKARTLWKQLVPAPKTHPYLRRKGVEPGPCRVMKNGTLVVPVRDVATDKLMSLQFIHVDGTKRFLKDSRTKRGCCILGDLDSGGFAAARLKSGHHLQYGHLHHGVKLRFVAPIRGNAS